MSDYTGTLRDLAEELEAAGNALANDEPREAGYRLEDAAWTLHEYLEAHDE